MEMEWYWWVLFIYTLSVMWAYVLLKTGMVLDNKSMQRMSWSVADHRTAIGFSMLGPLGLVIGIVLVCAMVFHPTDSDKYTPASW